jgi:hypothetical protein
MSYMVVPTSGLSAAKATALAGFIKFVLGATGQTEVESMGAAGVTPDMVAAGLKVADEVAAQAITTTTATTTTTKGGTGSATTTTTSTSVRTASSQQSSGSGDAAASNAGPSLALTGGVPWPVAVGAGTLVLLGIGVRRGVRSRLSPRGTKT